MSRCRRLTISRPLKSTIESVEPIATVWRTRNGDRIKAYSVYELKGYLGGVPY